MCGRSWCKQRYTKHGLTQVAAGRIQGEVGLDDRGREPIAHDHIIIKRTEETVLVQGMDG
jgi:hypothetical protein